MLDTSSGTRGISEPRDQLAFVATSSQIPESNRDRPSFAMEVHAHSSDTSATIVAEICALRTRKSHAAYAIDCNKTEKNSASIALPLTEGMNASQDSIIHAIALSHMALQHRPTADKNATSSKTLMHKERRGRHQQRMLISPRTLMDVMMTRQPAYLLQLPLTQYEEALRLQRAVHSARVADKTDDTLIVLEHPLTYTVGRRVKEALHCVDEDALAEHGIPIHRTERGGLITCHSPGQLVGYPILKLATYCRGPKTYMHMLEEVIIHVLDDFGLQTNRRDHCTGVWIDNRKIAALGVHINRGVTMHGFALNVMNDLQPYDWIIPCGIQGCNITNMVQELGTTVKVNVSCVAERLCTVFAENFGLQFRRKHPEGYYPIKIPCQVA